MFVGHYAVSFAVKSANRTIPLWILFLAVQLVDVFWAIFVLTGIEKVRIVPGITATNPLDLYSMPYTHSLVAAILWSVFGYLIYRYGFKPNSKAALLVGLGVLSHWFLDLIVHRPDLQIYDNTFKAGFGLWNYPVIAFALEAMLLIGGLVLYLRSSRPVSNVGKYGPAVFVALLILVQAGTNWGSPPSSPNQVAVTALTAYLGFAGIVYWIERQRREDEN